MTDNKTVQEGDQIYDEREAVAIFPDEASLNKAVDELMQAGIQRKDLSLLADSKTVPGKGVDSASLEDKDFVERKDYATPGSRTEAMAALVSIPVYIAGAGTAAVTGGALISTIAVVSGAGLAAGAVGLILARVFGKHHAQRVQEQIAEGGILLWVHLPDNTKDAKVLDILRRNGANDAHLHVVKRSWGVSDVPLNSTEPDPLLR